MVEMEQDDVKGFDLKTFTPRGDQHVNLFTFTLQPDVLYVQALRTSQTQKGNLSILLQPPLHAPYSTWPMGLSSSIPGAIKFVRGSPVALAAEQRAMVGELLEITSVK